MRYSIRKLFCIILTLLLCPLPQPASAIEERQHMIEAAFLTNFFHFIIWPGRSGLELGDITICVVGDDPIQPYLNYIRQEVAARRVLTVRQVQKTESLPGCHMLFSRRYSPALFETAAASGILTVLAPAEKDMEGGMIELIKTPDRIKVRIRQSALAQAGFQVSARLVELAEKKP